MYGEHPFDRIKLRIILLYWFGGAILLGMLATEFGGFWEQFPDYGQDLFLITVESVWMMALMILLGRRGRLQWPKLMGRQPNSVDAWNMSKLALFLVLLAYVEIYLIFVGMSFPFPDFIDYWIVSEEGLFYIDEAGSSLFLANLYMAFYLVVLVPIIEELMFRGFLLHRLTRKYGLNKGIVITSIVFGLLHISILSSILFGVAMCVVYIRTRSLGAAMLCHGFNNLIACGISLIYEVPGGEVSEDYTLSDFREEWYFGLIALAIAIIMAWVFVRKPLRDVAWELPDVSN